MATWKILYEASSRLPAMYHPVALYVPGDVDLEETKLGYLFDDPRPIPVKRWQVEEVTIPDWISPEEYIRSPERWAWMFMQMSKYGWSPELARAWMDSVELFTDAEMNAALTLLRTRKFRSKFRESLRDQIVDWLLTPPHERKYPRSPLSQKQWAAIIRPRYGRRYINNPLTPTETKGLRDAITELHKEARDFEQANDPIHAYGTYSIMFNLIEALLMWAELDEVEEARYKKLYESMVQKAGAAYDILRQGYVGLR